MKVTDHVFREMAPYKDGPDDVYWVDDKYVKISGVWRYILVGAGENDIVKDEELIEQLNNCVKEEN